MKNSPNYHFSAPKVLFVISLLGLSALFISVAVKQPQTVISHADTTMPIQITPLPSIVHISPTPTIYFSQN